MTAYPSLGRPKLAVWILSVIGQTIAIIIDHSNMQAAFVDLFRRPPRRCTRIKRNVYQAIAIIILPFAH